MSIITDDVFLGKINFKLFKEVEKNTYKTPKSILQNSARFHL